MAIKIFICYAHEDEVLLNRLKSHLKPLQRQGLIDVWHDRDISAGIEWDQEIKEQLNAAEIILLLVSPDFMNSDYISNVELKRAIERHNRRETYVIPIILRPIHWAEGTLGKLQALPKNAKPIALWRHREEAFFDVAEGIRYVIEEIKKQPSILPLSQEQSAQGGENLRQANTLEQKPLPEEALSRHEVNQESTDLTFSEGLSQTLKHSPLISLEDEIPFLKEHINKSRSKNRRKKKILLTVAILLALALSLVPFLPLPTCSFAFCHSSKQSMNQPSPQNGGEVRDHNLSLELIDVVSPSFVIPGDPHLYSNKTPPISISAVLLLKNAVSYCNIILAVQNLRLGGVDILVDYVALKLKHIPVNQRPLRVWTPGVSTIYNAYPYPVIYQGQSQDQLLYASPPQNVILQPARSNQAGESNQLSIQVMSTVTAYLQFQIQISYQIADAAQIYTLTLPQIFQVIFSDASNWQEYTLQNGFFVEKP